MSDGPQFRHARDLHGAGLPDSTRMSSDASGPSREPGTARERNLYTGASQVDPQSARRRCPRQYRGLANEWVRVREV
jgi:hypothetical protein